MTSSINASMGGREWIMLISLSVLWGGSFFFIGVAVADLPPLTIVTLRVSIAAVLLWTTAFVMGLRPPKGLNIWAAFLGMGLLNNVIPFSLIVWGQTQIASGLASILNAATPIFTVVVAGLFLPDERVTPRKALGVTVGFIGVVVMIGLPAINGIGVLAHFAVIAATLFYAFAGVFGRRFKTMGVNPLVSAAGQVTASSLWLAPVALAVDGPIHLADLKISVLGSVFGLAFFSTAIAYVLYFKILESSGATNLLLVTLLVPVSAILLGSLFLNEELGAVHYLGMAMIAAGLSIIDGRLWRSRKNEVLGN
ncbi:DMT family transporter [Marinobacter daepoensis]|uniref:DMT family transporter n=1 Tax=Marinobacter daepoensis TaxID=262077 RepID=UPI001C958C17|nr:DMT family transporter [Marinobacter daepoensis]MBY6032322.1 DMT family transporter [Marinobacter daepoensis]